MSNVKWLFVAGLVAVLPAGAMAMPNMVPPANTNAEKKTEKAAEQPPLSGKVLETMDSSGYTYILLETKGEKKWVAIPEMVVKVGETVELEPGVQMGKFVSKALDKTFESILFSGGPTEKYNEERKKNAHAGVKLDDVKMGSAAKKEGKVIEGLKVDKAAGANAYTVAEVFGKKAELNDKPIAVRGQVVKVSMSIMDHNWVHLQDGTGEAAKKNNNLVVTTKDKATVGDIVTATGTFHQNRDFGAGYKYDAIMEDAVLK
jgi:hypothetical protein